MTRGANIEYDLQKSPYTVSIGRATFVFSSAIHAQKFSAKLQEECKAIRKSLSKRFNLKVSCDELAAIKLYQKIELRGFLIVYEVGGGGGEKISVNSPENIAIVGRVISARGKA